MALNNFAFPSVTLKQVFNTAAAGTVYTLGTACIGSMFKLHRYNKAQEAALLSGTYTGLQDLTVDIPGKSTLLGETIDKVAKYQHLQVVDGIYEYHTESAETLAISDGIGTVTSAKVIASNGETLADPVFGTRGVKVGDTVIVSTVPVSEDDPVVELKAVVIALQAASATDSSIKKFVLSDVGSLTAGTVKVEYCLVSDTRYEQASDTFTLDYTQGKVTVKAGLDKDVTEELGSATSVEASLRGGKLYLEYRERSLTYVGTRGAVASTTDAEELAGPATEENPLGLALYFAVSAANGGYVYFSAVRSEEPSSYQEALDFLAKYNDVYSIVPATVDTDIIKACSVNVINDSEDEHSKIRRSLWYGINADEELTLYSGSATYTAGTSINAVRLAKNVFNDYPAQAGDYIRVTRNGVVTNAEIKSTNLFNTAYVTEDLSTLITSSTVVEVVRTIPTNAQLVANITSKRCTQSYRCQCIWADGIMLNGSVVPNYCGAAAAAGMRSAEECWRPLSNLSYSFFSVNGARGFTLKQLEEIASNGIWVIADNENGTPVNKKAITTAIANDVNQDNESVISNVDEIALAMCHVGEDKIGNSNISDLLLLCLRDDIDLLLSARTKNASSDYVGNQLLEYAIVDVWQDEVNKDEVYADMTVTPPKPFNQFHMTMRVI